MAIFQRRRRPEPIEAEMKQLRDEHAKALEHAEAVLDDFAEADGIVVDRDAHVIRHRQQPWR